MVLGVTRDEFLLGAYVNIAVDQVTNLALRKLGMSDTAFVRATTISVVNIGLMYSTGQLSPFLPGIIYGIGKQMYDIIQNNVDPRSINPNENKIWGTGEVSFDDDEMFVYNVKSQ